MADKIENTKKAFIAALVYPLQHSLKLLQCPSSYSIYSMLQCLFIYSYSVVCLLIQATIFHRVDQIAKSIPKISHSKSFYRLFC